MKELGITYEFLATTPRDRIPIMVLAPDMLEEARNPKRHVVLIVPDGMMPYDGNLGEMRMAFARAGYFAAMFDPKRSVPDGKTLDETELHVWAEDARLAFGELRERFPGHLFTVVGIGIGSYVAALLASEGSVVKNAILVAPKLLENQMLLNVEICCGSLLIIKFTGDESTREKIPDRYLDAALFMADQESAELAGAYHEDKLMGAGLEILMRTMLEWMEMDGSIQEQSES